MKEFLDSPLAAHPDRVLERATDGEVATSVSNSNNINNIDSSNNNNNLLEDAD